MVDSGIVLDNVNHRSHHVGNITIDDSKYCKLFKVAFHCIITGAVPEYIKFYMDFEFMRLIYIESNITEKELAELILMKQLMNFIIEDLPKSFQKIDYLCTSICLSETYNKVNSRLKQANERGNYHETIV